MNENKAQEITEDLPLTPVSEVITPVNNTDLDIDELIAKIDLLAQNENPYTVSKEVEELKSIFYIKLKPKNKEEETGLTEEENTIDTLTEEKTLHPLEIKFKLAYGNYKKIKFEFRKKRAQEEEQNLKTKRKVIEDIDKLTQEDEKKDFRTLQKVARTMEKYRECSSK